MVVAEGDVDAAGNLGSTIVRLSASFAAVTPGVDQVAVDVPIGLE